MLERIVSRKLDSDKQLHQKNVKAQIQKKSNFIEYMKSFMKAWRKIRLGIRLGLNLRIDKALFSFILVLIIIVESIMITFFVIRKSIVL